MALPTTAIKTRNPIRRQEKEVRREQILQAADQVFRAVGYSEASLEKIAEKAGISRGTIYFHFQTKEELVGNLLYQGLRRLVDRMEASVSEEKDVARVLGRMAEVYYDFFAEFTEQLSILASLQLGGLADEWTQELKRMYFEQAFRGVGILAGVIERGVKDGRLRPVDPLSTARLLWAASFGFMAAEGRPSRRPRDPGRFKKTIELGFGLLMNGLLKESGSPTSVGS